MASKAQFQKQKHSGTSKLAGSKTSIGSGSKRPINPTASGFVGAAKSTQIQVIFNGKIATPQSLLPRKFSGTETKTRKQQPSNLGTQPEDEMTEKFLDNSSRPPRKYDGKKLNYI